MSNVLGSPLPLAGDGDAKFRVRASLADYLNLSKSRIVLMVVITTAAGFAIGARDFSLLLLLQTLAGTPLVAAGTNALNQYWERNLDAKMQRTARRPLPAGRISPRAALIFSTSIAVIGTIYLGLAVNWLTAALGAFTLTSYIFVYTPLKRISTICTLVGAIPGAIPPLMGWTAATGQIGLGGLIVFGVLFLWQLPHFMAISWIYREDYRRAGFAMLSVVDADGRAVGRDAVLYSALLLPVSVAPAFLGMAGPTFLVLAAAAGAAMLIASIQFLGERSEKRARTLFLCSNIYLLSMMILFVALVRG